MQMGLSVRLSISYPLFNYIRSLFNELSVEINRIPVHSAYCVILSEDEVGGLLVVLVHHLAMSLALLRKLMGGRSISPLIGLARL